MAQGDDHRFIGNKILNEHVAVKRNQFGAAGCGIFFPNTLKLFLDDGEHADFPGEDIHQVFDGFEEFPIFLLHLVGLHSRQLVEPEFQDGIDLGFAKNIAALFQACLAANQDSELLDGLLIKRVGHELLLGLFSIG